MLLPIKHQGLAIIISSPSGAGKSSLTKALLSLDNNLKLSISATTRLPRSKEIEGKHYYFKNFDEFNALIKQDELLEYTHIYGNYYGTPKNTIKKFLDDNNDILFDIDFHGMKSIKKVLEEVVTIFILPPSLKTLKQRIQLRGDSSQAIEVRMQLAIAEIDHAEYYDYIVVNDNFEIAVQTIYSIIIAERVKRTRLDLGHVINKLLTYP